MSLENQINEALKVAMKARNEAELRGLRAIKSAIILANTSGEHKERLNETDEIKLLQKLVKQRNDSLEIFRQQKREDLAVKEEEEIAVIEKYLPAQMDEGEVRKTVEQIVEETSASSPADMGKVMGVAMKKLSGKADGKLISAIVKELLNR